MALKFNCQNCGKDIIVKFLKVGEIVKCPSCGVKNVVPESAIEVAEEQDYTKNSSKQKQIKHRLDAEIIDVNTREKTRYSFHNTVLNILQGRFSIGRKKVYVTRILFRGLSRVIYGFKFEQEENESRRVRAMKWAKGDKGILVYKLKKKWLRKVKEEFVDFYPGLKVEQLENLSIENAKNLDLNELIEKSKEILKRRKEKKIRW